MSVVERLERAARALRDEAEIGTEIARTKADALALEGELKETNRAIGAHVVREFRRLRDDAEGKDPEDVPVTASVRNLVEEALRLTERIDAKEKQLEDLKARSQVVRRSRRGAVEGTGPEGEPRTVVTEDVPERET